MIEPVGHASRHPAFSQCLQTSDENSHDINSGALPPRPIAGVCSTNFTWRHVEWPSASVLSYERPLNANPSCGTSFHSLHATSQALHPMQRVESVKKPVTLIALRVRSLHDQCRATRPRCAGEPARWTREHDGLPRACHPERAKRVEGSPSKHANSLDSLQSRSR